MALVKKGSTSEKVNSLEKGGSFGREKGALNRVSRASSYSSHQSHSPASSSLERDLSHHQSDSPNHSPLSSLEWSTEGTGEYVRQHSNRSSSRSTHSSPRVQQTVQSPISPIPGKRSGRGCTKKERAFRSAVNNNNNRRGCWNAEAPWRVLHLRTSKMPNYSVMAAYPTAVSATLLNS